jgi:hypothetical protein
MTEQPAWLLQLQRDLNTPVDVPDGIVINWDRCRDQFLIPMLRRLETKTSSPHPAIVRQLLERRLAGDDVTAELCEAATATADADAAWATRAARSATWANATADAAAWATDSSGERLAQVADLRAAVAASTQQPALPDGYLDGHITGPDRELLEAFYTACNSEGGTADEIHLRGIHAAIAHAATGGTVPTPVADALQRLLRWGGMPGSNGYDAQVVLGVVDWATSGMIGPLPPLPPLLARPVDLAALRDPTFSDGLTPSQHQDVLRGGPDPRAPLPVARPLSEWTDDDGDVLWWRVDGDSGEPPWVGSPLSDDWVRGIDDDYYTHWTPLPPLNLSATEQP